MRQEWFLDNFADKIKALPEDFHERDLLNDNFRILSGEKGLEIFYAPLDYVNQHAKVITVGITPGPTQMRKAYQQARRDLLEGMSGLEVCRRAKEEAGFAGPSTRTNLVSMLDGIGLPDHLGLGSSSALFSDHRSLLHTTSAIRYPVFVDRTPYTGRRPRLLRHRTLRSFLDSHLADELREVSEGIIVSLGEVVPEALSYLVEKGVVDQERCLVGVPHPSCNNAHRVRLFDERREALADQLRSCFAWVRSRA